MTWYDDLIRNLSASTSTIDDNLMKNLRALVGLEDLNSGMGGVIDPRTGEEVPPQIGMVSPGIGPGGAGAGRSLANVARNLVGQGGRSAAVRGGGRRAAGALDDAMGVDVLGTVRNTRPALGGGRTAGTGARGGQRALGTGRTTRASRQGGSATQNPAAAAARRKMGWKKRALTGAAGAGIGANIGSAILDNMRGEDQGRIEGTGGPAPATTQDHDLLDRPSIFNDDGSLINTGQAQQPVDPMAGIIDQINSQFDQYGSTLDDMGQVYQDLAETNMGTIADIFGETSGIANEGRGAVQDTYQQGQQNIGGIYDDLDQRLGGISGEMEGIAEGAAGQGMAGDIAEISQASIAPFQAASANARAAGQANMAQHSSAGQDYLSNLASASGEEGKMHASRVQAAADQRKAEFDIKRMEMEMAREEALREVAMDTAGSTAEREALAMLSQASGIPIPQGLDLSQAGKFVNLGQDLGVMDDPSRSGSGSGSDEDELNMMVGSLTQPGQEVLNSVIRNTEQNFQTKAPADVDNPEGYAGDRSQDFVFKLLDELEKQTDPRLQNVMPGDQQSIDAQEEKLIREIIRRKYGEF